MDRRAFVTGAAAAGAVLTLPARAYAGTEAQVQLEKVLRSVSELQPSRQLKWWEQAMGPNGRLWHYVREGDFSDTSLQHLFTILGKISSALNGPAVHDPDMNVHRERLPDIADVPHLYTIAAETTDGAIKDVGNVQVVHNRGRLMLQSSRHVLDAFRTTHPDFADAFVVPPPKLESGPVPDIAIAQLARAPIETDADRRVIDIPADFAAKDAYGQVNAIFGFKEDGGMVRHAGLVLPTPPKMLSRLYEYWRMPPVRSLGELHVIGQMQQGGLMLMPDFFGKPDNEGRQRALGRSGSVRLVYSQRHQSFVPGSNFMAIIGGRTEAGLSLGFVDSVSHAVRAYQAFDERVRSGTPAKTLLPRSVSNRPGYFQIAQGIYLRKVF